MQSFIVAAPAFLSGLSFATSGFGNALVFIFSWFLLCDFGVMDITERLKDCVFMSCIIAITAATSFTIRSYKDIDWKIVVWMSIFGCGGVVGGIETLKIVGNSVWAKRFAGFCFFISLCTLTQSPVGKESQIDLSSNGDRIGLACGCTLAGFLGGVFGTYGPPMIILVLLRNFERKSFQPNLSGFVIIFNSVQLIYNVFVWKSTESELIFCYIAVASGAIFGILTGRFLEPYISQALFRSILQDILFVASLSIMSNGFSFSKWITLGSFSLVLITEFFPDYMPFKKPDSKALARFSMIEGDNSNAMDTLRSFQSTLTMEDLARFSEDSFEDETSSEEGLEKVSFDGSANVSIDVLSRCDTAGNLSPFTTIDSSRLSDMEDVVDTLSVGTLMTPLPCPGDTDVEMNAASTEV